MPKKKIDLSPPPGVYEVSAKTYFAWEWPSNSALKSISKSPLHYEHDKKHPSEPTPAMAFGTGTHTLILEPDKFGDEILVIEKRPRKGSKAHTELHEAHPDKTFITEEEYRRMVAIKHALRASHTATDLLMGKNGRNEISIVWDDPGTGIRLKGRLDRVTTYDGDEMIVDLKTTANAKLSDFQKSTERYGYNSQGALYLAGIQAVEPVDVPRRFVLLAVESQAPHGVGIFEPTKASLDEGAMVNSARLATYKYCVQSGQWPGYVDTIQALDAPAWVLARRRREDDAAYQASLDARREGV